jgi:DNA-binding HxlR family transcriptional regulator
MNMTTTPDRAEAFHRVSDVLRCKWTLAVLEELDAGSARPSEIQRAMPGLTSKVLNDRLRKLERFGLIERTVYAEVPPRVEYTLNERGREMTDLIRRISAFVSEWSSASSSHRP